jgi:hypothetical protein
MIRSGVWLLAVAAAATTAPRTGCRAPRAHLAVERLPGGRPELVLLRCQSSGLKKPRYDWTLGSSVHQVGWGAPRDEQAMFVSIDGKAAAPGLAVSCRVSDEQGASAEDATSLAPIAIKSATAPKKAGDPIVVEGSGFGAKPGDDGALWLVPSRGDRRAADQTCKGASWSDARITACPPAGATGRYELRVESGGRLAATQIVLEPVK